MQEGGSVAERNRLILRYRRYVANILPRQANAPVDACAFEDAGQDAVFWIIEAIQRFDLGQFTSKNDGCSFRSFLYQVVTARFKDFVRRQRCLNRHERPGDVSDLSRWMNEHSSPIRREADPTTLVENQELRNRVIERLQKFDAQTQLIWALTLDQVPVAKIAVLVGLSIHAVKRRRRKLRNELSCELRQHQLSP